MAENIVVYVRVVSRAEVAAELGRLAEWSPGVHEEWYYPRGDETNTLIIDVYDGFPEQPDPGDAEDAKRRAAVEAALGGPPSFAVSLTLRRRPAERAVEDAAALSQRLLRALGAAGGAVDDNWSEIWTLDEIEAGVAKRHGRFLDWLRYPERRLVGDR